MTSPLPPSDRRKRALRAFSGSNNAELFYKLRALKHSSQLFYHDSFRKEGYDQITKRDWSKEPLCRVYECVFGVLAFESEPVDPRR